MSNIINKPNFVRDGDSVINASAATTLTCQNNYLLLLDHNCNKLLFKKGDDVTKLFERIKKSTKPNEQYGLILENGGFVDVRIIQNVFVSDKTDDLVIMGRNGRPLCVFNKKTYSSLNDLVDVLLTALVDVNDGNNIEQIDWSTYQ